jgi:putative addiction module killer protein
MYIDNGKICATIRNVIEIREYQDYDDHSPFGEWVDQLNAEAARKVTIALYRIGLGNFSNVKGIGSGVFEYKIHFGPGYRVYFGKHGERIVILLGGGTKHGQDKDIKLAIARWVDYKRKTKQKIEEE